MEIIFYKKGKIEQQIEDIVFPVARVIDCAELP